MAAEHRIRLAGPWELVQRHESTTIKLPCTRESVADWVDWSNPLSLRRRFNTPTNLAAGDRVFVDVPKCFGPVESVLLDGVAVHEVPDQHRRYDVTAGLSMFHTVQINLACCDEAKLTAAALVIAPAGAVQ